MNKHGLLVSMFLIVAVGGYSQAVMQKIASSGENIPVNTILERKWWNLLYYNISITPDCNTKFLKGSNSITFRVEKMGNLMQIDLQEPMLINAISWKNKPLSFERKDNAYFIHFPKNLQKGKTETISIQFSGYPPSTDNAPWGSGWIWTTDKQGRPWMSVACEGTGASIWLPCKNAFYDEPDNGVSMSITVPDTLVAIANGRLQKTKDNKNGTATYTWAIVNPINNYNIIPYIGKYVSWHTNYNGLKGPLDCDYWVLDYNEQKAKKHLQQTDTMLRCFEDWLGPYPFYEDSYKLVEAPFAGMEHQSAIAYGNGFENGYTGKNLSGTEWGLKWDFILIHESGHEWFGNSITASNDGESWIHEGFTKYLETIYTGYLFGKEAGNDYAMGISKRIKNDEPIIGSGTSDHYNKGSAMLHTIRQLVGDTTFKGLLRGLNQNFYHQTVSTKQILVFINQYLKKDFTKIFDQYLRTTQVPVLEYSFDKNAVSYRWTNCVDSFNMPLKVTLGKQNQTILYPTTSWQKLPVATNDTQSLVVDRNFYVQAMRKKLEDWKIRRLEN